MTPRALVDFDLGLPETYATGRSDAIIEQAIPLEITKIKHLEQIEVAPDTLTIEQIQADYPVNLTCCIEKQLPGYTRGDDWFGERMMNGMNRGCFVPDAARAGHYRMRYFGVCWYDINDLYALPDVDVLFSLKDDGLPSPLEIRLTGRLSRSDHDPFRARVFTAADGDAWLQAKRVARVAGAVCTEVEEHFAATHLNTEQYAVAAYRNLRLNPVAGLLLPHLKEASLVNHTAKKVLISGYIPAATALTSAGLQQRTRDILGLQDWRGWQPMKAISPAHTCAKAERLSGTSSASMSTSSSASTKTASRGIGGKSSASPTASSRTASPSSSPPRRTRRRPTRAIRNSLRNASSTTASSTDSIGICRARPSAANSRPCHGSPPPARTTRPRRWTGRNLKDACRYAIMQATYMHTWINEHQYDDLGEVRYSCGGLRFGDGLSEIMAPESDDAIAPDLTRSTQMLWLTNILSRTEFGFITRNEERDVNPHLIRLLQDRREVFDQLGVDIDAIKSRTNI